MPSGTFESVTGLPEIFGYVIFFVLGAAIGSFLNVVIHRVPKRESIVFPNSACPKCQKPIKAYDNFPVLSWLLLRGKCRNCRNPISPRYPAVEVLNALLFLLVFWQIGFNLFLPVALIFVPAMVALIFIDAENMILPDVITFPLFAFAIIVRITYPILISPDYFSDLKHYPLTELVWMPVWAISVIGAILGGLAGGGSLWLFGKIWKILRKVDAMGFGDVKMMFAVGALLGWRLALLSIFLGAFTGAVAGIFVIFRQKEKDFQAQVPFGIFLGIGSMISLLFGNQILAWYLAKFMY